MLEFMEDINETGAASAPPQALLHTLGYALLMGTAWEHALNDARWAYRLLYITYTHDSLGTPDNVEGVFFSRGEAEALASRVAQGISASHPQFYKFKVSEWPLGALAIREARDGFHHGVVRHLVMQIKAALLESGRLPAGVTTVSIGPAGKLDDSRYAYQDVTARRIVLWEDCCCLAGAEDSIDFTTESKPPLSGLMNAQGEIIVSPAFQAVAPLSDGLAVARRKGKAGYIDASGNLVVPFIYEDAAACCQDLLLVKSGGLWGAIDRSGNEVIPPRFEALTHDIGNEALRATQNGKYGYLSLSGELLLGFSEQPLDLAEHSFASERQVFIARDASVGDTQHVLVDALGRRIGMKGYLGLRYGLRDEGLLCAMQQEGTQLRYGYINLHGDTVIAFRFAAADNFSEGLAAVVGLNDDDRRYGYVDRQGNWAIAPRFESAGQFHQGLAPASAPRRAKWFLQFAGQRACTAPHTPRYGYIDRRGAWAIGQDFLEARAFSEGMAPVRHDKGWGYVDIRGNLAIPGPYHEAGPFKQGVARVARRYDGPLRYGLVDVCGREVIPLRFERLSYPQRGLISACDEFGLWGCFTLFGNIVAPFVYRDAHDLQLALAARGPALH